jgi:hypothetical protein
MSAHLVRFAKVEGYGLGWLVMQLFGAQYDASFVWQS